MSKKVERLRVSFGQDEGLLLIYEYEEHQNSQLVELTAMLMRNEDPKAAVVGKCATAFFVPESIKVLVRSDSIQIGADDAWDWGVIGFRETREHAAQILAWLAGKPGLQLFDCTGPDGSAPTVTKVELPSAGFGRRTGMSTK